MLTIKNYNKTYQQNHVLKDINLTINKGDVIALIGPSGSGKSTLLKTLNYLVRPDSGAISLHDQQYSAESIKKKDIYTLRQSMGMVFQNFGLFAHLSALQNLVLVLTKVQKIERSLALKQSKQALDLVGLSDKYDAYPHELSGGQQQRVGIARALVANPELLLLDEPTSALDPELIGEVQKVIHDLADHQQTMLVVTHEMSFAKEIANRVIFMEDGKIVIDAPPEVIFSPEAPARITQFIGRLAS